MRIFLDEGPDLKNLIRHWLASSKIHPLRGYAASILARFESATADSNSKKAEISKAGEFVETLSQREVEVLQIMAMGKTNKEIARQLIVAPGTVKAHTASIYRKLDAANRTEAVKRARELGLIS